MDDGSPARTRIDDLEQRLRAQLQGLAEPRELALALNNLLLARGDFQAGWAIRRTLSKQNTPPEDGQKPWLWRGERMEGQTLLVLPDEGYGDIIQYFPLLGRLARRGGKVVFPAPKALLRLFQHNGPEGVRFVEWESSPPGKAGYGADYFCAMGDLPGWFSIEPEDLPLAHQYLQPDPVDVALWRNRMRAAGEGLPRVGVVWRGNPLHPKDAQRSLSWKQMASLITPRCQFHSLQVYHRNVPKTEQEALPPEVVDWSSRLLDFSETAACISQLDAVLTVDTAVAHLAGAMGVPVLLLLDHDNDWRWRSSGSSTPWYASVRLIRQVKAQDWSVPLQEVAVRLIELAGVLERGKRVRSPAGK